MSIQNLPITAIISMAMSSRILYKGSGSNIDIVDRNLALAVIVCFVFEFLNLCRRYRKENYVFIDKILSLFLIINGLNIITAVLVVNSFNDKSSIILSDSIENFASMTIGFNVIAFIIYFLYLFK